MGFHSKANDKLLDLYNRNNVVKNSCQAGVKLCLTDSRNEFDNFVKGNYTYVKLTSFEKHIFHRLRLRRALNFSFHISNRIPDDLVPVVYRSVVEYGSETEWNYLWKEFKSSNVDGERKNVLKALGYTKRDDLIKVQ